MLFLFPVPFCAWILVIETRVCPYLFQVEISALSLIIQLVVERSKRVTEICSRIGVQLQFGYDFLMEFFFRTYQKLKIIFFAWMPTTLKQAYASPFSVA
jgi:hypothetical protein